MYISFINDKTPIRMLFTKNRFYIFIYVIPGDKNIHFFKLI